MRKETRVIMRPEEAREKIRHGEEIPPGTLINGDLWLKGEIFKDRPVRISHITLDGDLFLDENRFEVPVIFKLSTFMGAVSMKRSIFLEDLRFSYIHITDWLDLKESSFENNRELYFNWVTINGWLDFSFKKAPVRIYVTPDLAQRVHWAAPTTPLVVGKLDEALF